MEVIRTKSELRTWRAGLSGTLGLVPTMGYLHAGHMSLVAGARAGTDKVIASIFVNPTQFGPNEDLARYPRDLDRDLAMLSDGGVDAVFTPSADEVYGPGAQTHVEVARLSRILIGRLRPGHFRGVATVVAKLFNLTRPDNAYFGQKDYQQLAIIRTLVRDLDMGVRIKGMPTMREPDGLAMSSRNVRLTPEHRAEAPALSQALDAAAARPGLPVSALRRIVRERLSRATGAEIASIDIRDAQSLAPVAGVPNAPVVILLAVRFGGVLLIDNRVIDPETP